MVKKKMGRPTQNPKSSSIHIRLDNESLRILDNYSKQERITRTEGVRRGIQKLKKDLK